MPRAGAAAIAAPVAPRLNIAPVMAAALALSACVSGPRAPAPPAVPPAPVPTISPSPPPPKAPPASAWAAGLSAGPPVAELGLDAAGAERALAAFRLSCPSLVRRQAAAGIPGLDWTGVCAAAERATSATGFFADSFETVTVGDGRAFVTGYYEPEIAAARTAGPDYRTPIYRRPPDLIEADLGAFAKSLAGRTIRGRVENGRLVPYFDRTAIEQGALAGKGLEIGWAADPVALFFLQVQGSGRLRLPDGSIVRIGYAGQNGHDYVGIGALLRQRGLLGPGQATMQGISAWIAANGAAGTALMRENPSYVFFRELTGPGPLGALGLPVTSETTLAADPRFVPLGAPVHLAVDRAEANGLWIAQDTGGAIKGANRFDSFWGAGARAAEIAGGMSARGRALLLLPKGSLARARALDTTSDRAGDAAAQR